MFLKVISLFLLVTLCVTDYCPGLAHCFQCDVTDPTFPICFGCLGWYESDANDANGYCIISKRLVIVTIVGFFLFVGIVACVIVTIKENNENKHLQQNNI
jgi:hypothetical protein